MAKTAKHSPLPWGHADEHCKANWTVTDANGIPVLQIHQVAAKPGGVDRVRESNTALVTNAVNHHFSMAHLLRKFVAAVPRDLPGLAPGVIDSARDVLKRLDGS
jgi:hypothetical protein